MRRACGNQVLEVLHEVGQCHGRTNLHALLSGLQLVELRHGNRGHHHWVLHGLELHLDAHFCVAHHQLRVGVLCLELQQTCQAGGAVPGQARAWHAQLSHGAPLQLRREYGLCRSWWGTQPLPVLLHTSTHHKHLTGSGWALASLTAATVAGQATTGADLSSRRWRSLLCGTPVGTTSVGGATVCTTAICCTPLGGAIGGPICMAPVGMAPVCCCTIGRQRAVGCCVWTQALCRCNGLLCVCLWVRLCKCLEGIQDGAIPGAAAEVTPQRIFNVLLSRGLVRGAQQGVHGHDKTWGAKSALGAVGVGQLGLHRVHPGPHVTDAFHCHHVHALHSVQGAQACVG
mmetsp:Transcript_14058/g.37986  ORF Transcript_14058/g.37986 Transcript_14058/m.37986 type:complete len:343 (-) Transcript_14058:241-1269(-)